MKYEFDAVAIGTRIRQARQAKGWNQETLAERADTSAQNISKFEKNGLSDMNWITVLSNILDTNLLEATIDIEGEVGEIGKEILFTLICFEGNLFFEDFIDRYMYGLSQNQFTNEIVKLAKIGLVVRENYSDWDGKERDRIFITAKGLITFKNLELNNSLANTLYDEIDNVVTYEQLLGDENSYDSYIKHNEAERLIRKFDFSCEGKFSAYRINFIKYLKENFETKIDKDPVWDYFFDEESWCPSEQFYHDIIHRMTFDATDEVINNRYNEWKKYMEIVDDFLEAYDSTDEVIRFANKKLTEEFDWIDKEVDDGKEKRYLQLLADKIDFLLKKYNMESPYEIVMAMLEKDGSKKMVFESEEEKRETAFIISCWINSEDIFEVCGITPNEDSYLENKGNREATLPTEWFSDVEIKEFIIENFGEAKNEYEKNVDASLKKIIELIPNAITYFAMPEKWEENGLADLVRNNVGLSKMEKESTD